MAGGTPAGLACTAKSVTQSRSSLKIDFAERPKLNVQTSQFARKPNSSIFGGSASTPEAAFAKLAVHCQENALFGILGKISTGKNRRR